MKAYAKREMLTGAAAVAASTLRGAPADRELRTAMIGIGHRGTSLLDQVLRQENVRITAMSQFYRAIRENRKPVADIKVAATAALTAIMGREAI